VVQRYRNANDEKRIAQKHIWFPQFKYITCIFKLEEAASDQRVSYISHKSVIAGWLKSGETTGLEAPKRQKQNAKERTHLGHFVIANLVFIVGQKSQKEGIR
jgi:hypothetical protein